MTFIPTYTLADGMVVPAIGFGTYKLNGMEGKKAIVQAVHNGYRWLDSAFNYENEGAVGQAIRECGVPRSELQITSKLPGRRHRYQEAVQTIQESLWRAQLEYYDFYLVHWPNPITDLYIEAWQALIEGQKRGYIRSIGVCNFLPEHLDRLINETGVMPVLNQIELHPYFSQKEQRAYNKKLGILTQSWSPMGRASKVLNDLVIETIAVAHQKTTSQIILRWHVQLGCVPIPKSASETRQRENLSLFDFELSSTDMEKINALTKENGRLKNQNPAQYEEF
ncbi:2,5-diketo-D-gluconic acid reductase B [Commensalibacter sp. Nvir]|uniref:aldo/keto reductase n=1 Tax=Commensalibacter sp. Nvir TaxID=3069817 RepID=UPI002D3C948F|nr:2,5-diketo-D-gluconic acid reductase B [Commensalibacter sp. Nvir]